MLICLYVDDFVVTGTNIIEKEEFIRQMMREFDMADLGKLIYFLEMEFN